MKAELGNHPLSQTHVGKIPLSGELQTSMMSGPGGMCMFLGCSQIPTPGDHESHSSADGKTCQSPTPAARWHQIPFQASLPDNPPKRSEDHMSDLEAKPLSTECGVSNSTPTDVLSRLLQVTTWSFPFLQIAKKYTPTWPGGKQGPRVSSQEGLPLPEISQDVFLSPAFSTF